MLSLVGEHDVVTGVVGEGAGHFGDEAGALFLGEFGGDAGREGGDGGAVAGALVAHDRREEVVVVEVEVDALDGVGDAGADVLGEGLGEGDAGAGAAFVVERAEEAEVAVIEIDFEGEPLAEEPGLDEGDEVILAVGCRPGRGGGVSGRRR